MNFATENIKNIKIGKNDCLLHKNYEEVHSEKAAGIPVELNLSNNNASVKEGKLDNVMTSKKHIQPLITQKPVNGTHTAVFVQKDVLPTKFTKGKLVRIISGLFLMFNGIISFIYTPFDVLMRERLRMTPGLPAHDWWANPPDEVHLKVYLFNVTNSVEFLDGTDKKLKIQEVGPFVFLEKLIHTNITFNDNGTLTYIAHRSAIFLPHLSSISLDTRLIIPNLALLGGASYFADSSFIMKIGFNMLVRRLSSSPFVEINANDYMWNFTDPLLELSQKMIPSIVPVENLGLLSLIYREFVDEVTVYMGPGNDEKFFLIDKFHGSPRLGAWPDERCDSVVNSTEGVTYPQFLKKNSSINYLRKTLCRTLPLEWRDELIHKSMTAYRYELPETVFHRPKNASEDCFTLPEKKSLPSGISDVSPCFYNYPIGSSLPHFYGGTQELLDQVEGLKADKEKHGSYVLIEPITGIPFESRARSQCNLIVKSLSGFSSDVNKFSDTIIPLFWAEYGQQDLPLYATFLVYLTVVIIPNTQHWYSLISLLAGVSLLYAGFASHFLYIYRRFVFRYHKFEKISFGYFK